MLILYTDIILIFIAILPKINIVSVNGNAAGIRMEDLLIVVYILFDLANIVKKGKIKCKFRLIKIFICFIFVNIISTSIGILNFWINSKIGFFYLLRKIEYFYLFIIGYKYFNPKTIKKFDKFIDYTVIFHFIISILQIFGIVGSFNRGEMLSGLTQGRISSTFNGAYEYSAFLLLIISKYLIKIFKYSELKFKNVILLIISVIGILMTESRTSIIILVFLFSYILMKSFNNKTKKIVRNFFMIVIVFFVIIFGFNNQFYKLKRFENIKIESIKNVFFITWKGKNFEKYVETRNWYGNNNLSYRYLKNKNMDASLYIRVSHWMQMIDGVLKHNFLLGLGDSISGGSADGNYIRILSECGIIGLVIWLNLIFYIFKSLNENEFSILIKYAFLTITLGAFFIDLFEASKIMMFFWFAYGMAIANQNLKKENSYEIFK